MGKRKDYIIEHKDKEQTKIIKKSLKQLNDEHKETKFAN